MASDGRRLELPGRTALVTGGARGIGYESARQLRARGASVALLDLDRGEVERVAGEIGEGAVGIECDVTDEKAVRIAVEAVVEQLGGVDVVVANAGVAPPVSTVSALEPAAFDRVLDVNLRGVVHTVRQSLPQVIERRGHVVVIASVYAFANGVMAASYAMSKAAVEQLGRALRAELAPHGASAGVGYFGFVDTAMVRDAFADPLAGRLEQRFPRSLTKRIAPAEAATALVDGIERRAARTLRPRRWAPFAALRGLINPPFDAYLARDAELRAVVLAAEQPGGSQEPGD